MFGIDPGMWLQHTWRNRLQSLLLPAVMFNPAISPRLVMRLYGAAPIGLGQIPALGMALSRLIARAGLPEAPVFY